VTQTELTIQEAADQLNVSLEYMEQLLEKGEIPQFKPGSLRPIRIEDFMAYKHKRDKISRAALDELAAQAQELKMGYE